jgi:predicted dehydrogenase
MKEYRVGIIGFGFMGKVHSYSYMNMPFFYSPPPLLARITHICAGSLESARRGAGQIHVEHAVSDFRQVTENPDIDIVHICTPNHLHCPALLSAIRHGKHIYCEKPLTATLDEARRIESALKDYRGASQMSLQNRFFPATLRAKQLIQEGFLGQVLEFRASYLHSGSADPAAPLKWKLSAAAGGGVIADLGPHVLDLVHFLLGDYERLIATTKTAYAKRPSAKDPGRLVDVDAEDCVMILAKMTNGAIGNIEATKLASGAEDEIRIEIHGSRGALRFNGMDPHHLQAYDASADDEPIGGRRGWTSIDAGQRYPAPAAAFPAPKTAIGWLRAHVASIANFLQSIAQGKPGDPNLRHGILLQELLEAARTSARTGQWISPAER